MTEFLNPTCAILTMGWTHTRLALSACTLAFRLTLDERQDPGDHGLVVCTPPGKVAMHQDGLRLLILSKLADGRLPLSGIPRVWGGPGNGEICDACEIIVPKDEFVVGGISLAGGKRPLQLHVRCFWIWESERRPQLASHEWTTAPVIASGSGRTVRVKASV